MLREHTAPARTSLIAIVVVAIIIIRLIFSPAYRTIAHSSLFSLFHSLAFFLNNNNHHYGYIYRITRMPFSVLVSFFRSTYIIFLLIFSFGYNYNLDYTLKTFLFTENIHFIFAFFPMNSSSTFSVSFIVAAVIIYWKNSNVGTPPQHCSKRILFNFHSQKKQQGA